MSRSVVPLARSLYIITTPLVITAARSSPSTSGISLMDSPGPTANVMIAFFAKIAGRRSAGGSNW